MWTLGGNILTACNSCCKHRLTSEKLRKQSLEHGHETQCGSIAFELDLVNIVTFPDLSCGFMLS
jgi:hypothetical protein